jgi:hypothetical protein
VAGDNLTVTIGADTSKLRSEIKLTSVELTNLGKQINAAVKAGDTARAKQLSDTYGSMADRLAGLKRGLGEVGSTGTQAFRDIERAAVGATRGLEGFARSGMGVRRMMASLTSFRGLGSVVGGASGGLIGGLIGFGAARIIEEINQKLEETNKQLAAIRDKSREALLPAAAVQASQRIAAAQGVKPEEASKFLTGPAKALATFQSGGPGATVNPTGVRDITRRTDELNSSIERGVQVNRAASKTAFDLGKAYEFVGINLKDYKGTEEDNLRLSMDTVKAFQAMAKSGRLSAVQLNELSKTLFEGKPAQSALEEAPKFLADIQKQMNALKGPLAEHEKNVQALEASRGRLKNVLDQAWEDIGDFWNRNTAAINNWRADSLEKFFSASWWASIQGSVQQGWADIQSEFAKAWEETWKLVVPPLDAFTQGFNDIVSAAQDAAAKVGQAFTDAYASAKQTLSTSFPGDPSIPAMPDSNYASGGMVRGAGTGTSDSILARLSNGEFVMRAAAVRNLGAGFLSNLNRFAGGGMVMPSRGIPSFAAGGLVAMGGHGAVVNLVFPGGTFSLRGDNETVGALTREAQRAGVL